MIKETIDKEIKRELRKLTDRSSYERYKIIERASKMQFLFIKLSGQSIENSSQYYSNLLRKEIELGEALIKGLNRNDFHYSTLIEICKYLIWGHPDLSVVLTKREKDLCRIKALKAQRTLLNQLI